MEYCNKCNSEYYTHIGCFCVTIREPLEPVTRGSYMTEVPETQHGPDRHLGAVAA